MRAELGRWIREHQVCYETMPLREVDHGGTVHVGYELSLFAGAGASSPGDAASQAAYEHLKEIASEVFPREGRPSQYEVGTFDASWRLRAETRWRPEVQLVVRIIHRAGYLGPADECELRCLHEIQQGLRRLGVAENLWETNDPSASRVVAS